MIIGQEMAEICHGGGGRTVPFLIVVWYGRFFGDRVPAKKLQYLQVALLAAGCMLLGAFPVDFFVEIVLQESVCLKRDNCLLIGISLVG
jgi:hypothetical protein